MNINCISFNLYFGNYLSVFVDAEKKKYLEYVKAIIGDDGGTNGGALNLILVTSLR